jgi:hypothetical protein
LSTNISVSFIRLHSKVIISLCCLIGVLCHAIKHQRISASVTDSKILADIPGLFRHLWKELINRYLTFLSLNSEPWSWWRKYPVQKGGKRYKEQLLSFVHLFIVLTTARDKCICVGCKWCHMCQTVSGATCARFPIVSAYINVTTIYVRRIFIYGCIYIPVFGSSNSESRRRRWISSLTSSWFSTVPTGKRRNGISNKPRPLHCRLYLLHTNNNNT